MSKRIYQNEKVLLRELGIISTIEIKVIKEETHFFEGTEDEQFKVMDKHFAEKDVVAVYYK